ncbi:MAG: hypothetical protein JNM86_15905 [Phycisphaerae bacterium]|nr:hypothetical protein [Phycisphaerae bacterium]
MSMLAKVVLAAGSTTMGAACVPASGAIYFYDIFYLTYYDQVSSVPPTEYSRNSFTARMIADPGDIGVADFSPPLAPTVALAEIAPGYFFAEWPFFSPDLMVDAFPAGLYYFGISGGTMGFDLGEIERPEETFWCDEIPAFSNFDDMQIIDSTIDFVAEFNTFSAPPPANLGVTFLSVYDSSGTLVFNEFFPPTDGSRTIPVGTLLPGRSYTAILFFSSRIELPRVEFGGSTSIAAFDRVTSAPMFVLPTCIGDLNYDGFVDDADFVLFVPAYDLLDCADSSMPAGCPADFNRDNLVDDADFVLFVAAYNELLCP